MSTGLRLCVTQGPAKDNGFRMDLADDESAFLRDLVKTSRQKTHLVQWIDRDGTGRATTLTQAEVIRLNAIATRLKTSKSETLRRAAHVPVLKEPR